MIRQRRSMSFTYGDDKTDFASLNHREPNQEQKSLQQQPLHQVNFGIPLEGVKYKRSSKDSKLALSQRQEDVITRDNSSLKIVLGAQITLSEDGKDDRVYSIYAGDFIVVKCMEDTREVVFSGCARTKGNQYMLAVYDTLIGRGGKVPIDAFLGIPGEFREQNTDIAWEHINEMFHASTYGKSKQGNCKIKQEQQVISYIIFLNGSLADQEKPPPTESHSSGEEPVAPTTGLDGEAWIPSTSKRHRANSAKRTESSAVSTPVKRVVPKKRSAKVRNNKRRRTQKASQRVSTPQAPLEEESKNIAVAPVQSPPLQPLNAPQGPYMFPTPGYGPIINIYYGSWPGMDQNKK